MSTHSNVLRWGQMQLTVFTFSTSKTNSIPQFYTEWQKTVNDGQTYAVSLRKISMLKVCGTVCNRDGSACFNLIPIMLQMLYLTDPHHKIICFIARITNWWYVSYHSSIPAFDIKLDQTKSILRTKNREISSTGTLRICYLLPLIRSRPY